ncbi:hypothetical protein ES319_D12G163200v1 [Gossypium barbadense]|uniref:BES1/BZR1 plant transcription factor N-terminal domain-containing protein n=3 Tax=Gossypium TaxID=3633 RepID=A0A5J5NZ64_GOSBA|nr:hypothetical protein ES319_D12G163200v1 [Gossypium barbadense]TYG41400.1 hypothetical protein ES288_D12G172400v1 [Gossypium darwinii]TYH39326.1 hypothetical protein ES332_D12G172400v1 [Gossypium tomentosum]
MAAKIYFGNYKLPKQRNKKEVLEASCSEARWCDHLASSGLKKGTINGESFICCF